MIIIQCDKCDYRITVNQYLVYEKDTIIINIHNQTDVKTIKESMNGADYFNGKPMQFCKIHTEEMVKIKNEAEAERRKKLEKWVNITLITRGSPAAQPLEVKSLILLSELKAVVRTLSEDVPSHE